jgi:phosphatidate cytidylyltransferase
MLFTLPEYHHDIHQPLVAGSLWISLAWWVAALLLVLFYPAPRRCGVIQKCCD